MAMVRTATEPTKIGSKPAGAGTSRLVPRLTNIRNGGSVAVSSDWPMGSQCSCNRGMIVSKLLV